MMEANALKEMMNEPTTKQEVAIKMETKEGKAEG